MQQHAILSRRNVEPKEKTDFRPEDPSGTSPFAQLRRLSHVLSQNVAPVEDYADMDDALSAYREYLYRKVFSGTTHEDFLKLDESEPQRIDWLLAVAQIDAENYRAQRAPEKRNR